MGKSEDPKESRSKVTRLDSSKEYAKREKEAVLGRIRAEFDRPQTPVPQEDLDKLYRAAHGVTGQSEVCRNLLWLLVGENQSRFSGQGLLELRILDREICEAYLSVLSWWSGPTSTDEPLWTILNKLEREFPPESK